MNPELMRMHEYWSASNYLAVGQIYLFDNPLLREPLKLSHVKPLVVGHWGTTPGQNFIYVHLNRVIKKYGLNMFYVAGPGHGGPAILAQTYLEGSYTDHFPEITQDLNGLKKLFTQFSFPGGISSHVGPTTPGSIHEGGELGYSLSHAFGAVFDNRGLIVACVVGDGEAETGPLATAWHSHRLLNIQSDGVVLPILHLNGYKISNPTLLARMSPQELDMLLKGYGWEPLYVEGDDPLQMHPLMSHVLEKAIARITEIKSRSRTPHEKNPQWPHFPMIVLRSPKGWTGPKVVDGLPIEGNFRSHQVPVLVDAEHPKHLEILESWMRSYSPEKLFDEDGRLRADLLNLAPTGAQRMGSNPHTNGGTLLRDLRLPPVETHSIDVKSPGGSQAMDTSVLAEFLRDVLVLNAESNNFRIFGPDETLSNLLGAVFDRTTRQWDQDIESGDEFLAPMGRVLDSMLSEHQCEGWLEGYLLTGRHGLFNSYEAFIHIIDSMFNQHVKWLSVTAEIPWRRKLSSLNYLLTSHVWQQDHNGFTHQDPGFIDHMISKSSEIIRIYLPPDGNCLLSVMDHCLRSRHKVNLVIAGKHAMPQWLSMTAAVSHCTAGLGIWEWASNDRGLEPDLVFACAGDTPTLEALAAVSILRKYLPELKIRVVNIVDLMMLIQDSNHTRGLSQEDYDSIFSQDSPIVFAFHGYPGVIQQLTYTRHNRKLVVHGYLEHGTVTTPFDMRVQNEIDRFHLVLSAIQCVPTLETAADYLKQKMHEKLIEHKNYIAIHGMDMPEILNWKWE